MRRVRVSVTIPESLRQRLANQARSRPESLDAHLGRLILAGAGLPEPGLVEELRSARAEAAARAQELGAARRRIRELEARLNALHASGERGSEPPPWSLDAESRSPAGRIAWWRWLAAGVERLRKRYGVIELGHDSHLRGLEWWWASPARLRAIAVAVAWEEALDRGGDSVPNDPRYGEAFLEYLWRLRSRDLTLCPLGYYGHLEERHQAERAAFELHLSGLATISPPVSGPSPAGPGAAGGSRPS